MKITLIRPPFYALLGNFKPVYHLGLGAISAVLKAKGHNVFLIDGETMIFEGFNHHKDTLKGLKTRLMPSKYLNLGFDRLRVVMENPQHQVWKTLTKAVVLSSPDLVGITCFTQNVPAVIHLTSMLKAYLPEVPIVLGGIHPTADPILTMQYIKDVDYIVIGEGEETIVELCGAISEKKKQYVSKVRGIIYRENGQIKNTSFRPLIHDLEQLPFPDRTLGERRNYYNADTIFTSRGCPFECIFCASNVLWKRKIRYRTLDNILSEIDFLINQYNTTRIRIDDDTFTLSKKRVVNFCNRIKKMGLSKKVSFSLGSRVDTLDEEMIQLLAEIGTDTISFGIESGSPRILEKIHKEITPAQIENTIRLTSSYGIRCLCYFMIGHPEETVDDVGQSIELFDRIANRFVDGEINIVTPYPATQLWTIAREKVRILSPHEFYKFFHQGDFLVNLSGMTEQELKYYYNVFLQRLSKHGIVCKANTLARLLLTGRISSAFRLILN
jgi:radical SAM superfamily enzyme YgiQ (UPF0313 family)